MAGPGRGAGGFAAGLKDFDTAKITSDDHPETADWHAPEEGQQDRRLIATEDKTALRALADGPPRTCSAVCLYSTWPAWAPRPRIADALAGELHPAACGRHPRVGT